MGFCTQAPLPDEVLTEDQAAMQAMEESARSEKSAAIAAARKEKRRKEEQAKLDKALNFG